MSLLPTEVLQSICQYAGEPVVGWSASTTPRRDAAGDATCSGTSELHFLSLLAFSAASRHFRAVSVPYVFRRLRVRTVEEAILVSKSSLLRYARHLNLPAVDILTARRPVPPSLNFLAANVKSIRIASTTPSFYYAGCTPLARLLSSARALDTLELDCDPILESTDTMPILAGLISALPSSLTALRVSMPGGQPEYEGSETLLNAFSQPHHPLPKLNSICLSMHMAPILTAKPEKLAIALARRSPSLRYVTFIAPGRNPQRGSPLWDLISPQNQFEPFGGFRQKVMGWEFCRDLEGDEKLDNAHDTTETSYSVNAEGFLWEDARMFG
ncbi:hypothetical protein FRC12_013773 [Ceratobasidium sp. 428]|nr:hypothetical protein FRC12_013773 [Ceratobasidium sp. 428]